VEPVNLVEALEIFKQALPEDAQPLRTFLACGFTPLHLQTFLAAHLRKRLPRQRVEVKTGLFGDVAGSIERLQPSEYDILAVVIEWQDLDPRLGIRSLGGWRETDLPDIVKSAHLVATRLEQALRRTSAFIPECVCLPTLPLPPLFTTPTRQASDCELRLRQLVASFAASISSDASIRVLNSQRLDELSPAQARLDVQTDLMAGFPYKLHHASAIAELLAALIQNPTPKKGLITDLDNTLWAGILGEVGTEGISWDLDQHTHMHGLYQQFLGSLASAGVLIAVASKNDPALVEKAFERKDLIFSKESVYPFEVHWSRKSESVQRILTTWNIGYESVVFIDDSPMEVAEVKRMRDLFGKTVISEEDSIRLESIRGAGVLRESLEATGGSLDDFLQSADASIRFTFGKQAADNRAFELINKTNQFNLNGKRLTDAAWKTYLNDSATFVMAASYEDKFGPLGKIAALLGRVQGKALRIDSWVMSCRAFSRRIEHQSLKQLFDKFDAEEIAFDYQATPRNGPLQEFFTELLGSPLTADVRLSRAAFSEKSPSLFHRVEEAVNG
jgi:FkbH-like protein